MFSQETTKNITDTSSSSSSCSISTPKKFKVVLVGDGGVGKTALVQHYLDTDFLSSYISTMGVEVRCLRFYTTVGEVILNIWDTAGQEKFGANRDGYYIGADAALIMFDVTAKCTYRSVPKWYSDLRMVGPDIPIVLTGNKIDCKSRVVTPNAINFHRKVNLQYYDISVKSNYNTDKLFLYLIRRLLRDDLVYFVDRTN
jgi:GTP-binding nuclear protein Ran